MQTLDERVEKYLKMNFQKVRRTEKGFKINVEKLNKYDMSYLYDLECTNDVLVKRSGTGLVVIIE